MGERHHLHVVLGGSGGIGSALVAELNRRGHRVRSVSRRGASQPHGVEAVTADVAAPREALEATRGATVIYQAASPAYHRWPDELPALQRAVIEACEAHGAKLVMTDNLDAYGPVDGTMTEDTPPRPAGRKGRLRARLAEELLEAHRSGRVRVAIDRASDYFRPRGRHSALGDVLFGAAVARKTTRWFGRLDVPMPSATSRTWPWAWRPLVSNETL